MPSETAKASLGYVTSYGAARRGGYQGTYEEWCALMAEVADHLEENIQLNEDSQAAKAAAETAELEAEAAALTAESWAKGTKGGTDVPSTDPAYHDNAKYYAGEAEDQKDLAEQAASAAAGSAETAEGHSTDAEAWAAGTRGGEDVESGDDAYHNNAKYYSEQSSGFADDAAGSASDAEAWAKGTKNGTDVPSTDPTYHNNAKYWSEQAEETAEDIEASSAQIAQNASDIGDLKTQLDNTLKIYAQINQDEFTVSGYFNTDGSPHNDDGGNWYKTNSISLENVDKIKVNLYQNPTLIAPVVFYSAPGVVLAAVTTIDSDAGNEVAYGEITIPSGAVYVRFGVRNADSGQYARLFYNNLQDTLIRLKDTYIVDTEGNSETNVISQTALTKLNTRNAKINILVNAFPNAGYIKPNGTIQDDTSGNWGYSDLISIPYGTKTIYIKSYYNPSINSVIAFYNNVGTRISSISTIEDATSGEVYEGTVDVPDNTFYIRVNSRIPSGEQYAVISLDYNNIITELIEKKNCVFAETLAKPFVNSGANAIGFGDSIMYGYRSLDPTDVSANPWPDIVKTRCGFNNFTNKAVGGAGFTVGSTILTQMSTQTLSTRDYIFISAGTNDYHYAATISSFETAVETAFAYIDANKGVNTKVIVITPINRSQAAENANAASLDIYRSVLTKSALEHGYSVIDGRLFGFPETESDYQSEIMPDGLHPNDNGYLIYANHICGLLL